MRYTRIASWIPVIALALAAAACRDGAASTPGTPGPGDPKQERPLHPGVPVELVLPAEEQAELDQLQAELETVKDLDADGFAAKYAVPFSSSLDYDPLAATGLALIQGSALALDDQEQHALQTNGFVITERRRFPSFVYGYQSIYSQDLPVFVSADSILYAVHESYDVLLAALETAALIPALERLLGSMRAALTAGAGSELSAEARADVDLYLSVATSLLQGKFAAPVANADATAAQELYAQATAANGWQSVVLFDIQRDVDFSQFQPRGHYTDSPALSQYFRALMWLGRIDLRIIETKPDFTQVFNRRQLEAAYALRELMNQNALVDWQGIDSTIEAFVGEPDNMTLAELDALLADLGLSSAAELAKVPDSTIAQAVIDGGYGRQRISSQIMINGLGSGTLPLSSVFLLFGQRYVLDSHVFSNVVYDRVQGGNVYRMLPNPLDVGFAALANNQAGLLLLPELEQFRYAPDLASMRILADAHPQSFWDANLYNLWLGALRTLSPGPALGDPAAAGLPRVAATEAWGRRLLETQHASWAELRHDTILYAKQSYTGGATCEYPDAYVDPYPELYARLAAFASRGATLVSGLDLSAKSWVADRAASYFANLEQVALTLEAMAENQRSGAPHSAEQIAFINQAITIEQGCGDPVDFSGWYAQLFFDRMSAIELDPVIADVHTQPTDELGNPVGRVLHVATGMPRLMVVTANGCNGPRAYAGLTASYFERITEQFHRIDDAEWSQEISAQTPPDVPWMSSIVVR